jgi:hypothetical protein
MEQSLGCLAKFGKIGVFRKHLFRLQLARNAARNEAFASCGDIGVIRSGLATIPLSESQGSVELGIRSRFSMASTIKSARLIVAHVGRAHAHQMSLHN